MSKNCQDSPDLTEKRVPPSKIEGALLGAAIGDALGWPQERPRMRVDRPKASPNPVQLPFQIWKRRAGGRFWSHIESIKPGEYSDDTQLLLAVVRSLTLRDNWLNHFCRYELSAWLLYERGGGRATRAAAQLWQKGVPPWRNTSRNGLQKYFMAGGNGVTMRVLPHALLQKQPPDALCWQIAMNGIATHAHPRALLSAQLYGYATWYAARIAEPLKFGELISHLLGTWQVWSRMPDWGKDQNEWLSAANRVMSEKYATVWSSVVEEMRTGLQVCQTAMEQGALAVDQSILEQLGCFDPHISGAGTVSALAAVYLASRYAADPVTGLLEAGFAQGADTDTIASMTGGLLGALHGRDWIPNEWESVQDRQYILSLATSLAHTESAEHTELESYDGAWDAHMSKKVMERLESGAVQVFIKPLGHCTVQSTIEHKPVVQSIAARSYLLSTQDGQTIYIKKLARRQPESQTAVLEPPEKISTRESPPLPARGVLDPGIYANLFEVILHKEVAEVMVTARERFPSLKTLRDTLQERELDVQVYAWDQDVFGYGRQVELLAKFGFGPETITLRDHPRLTERMIVDGYVCSLEEAGYTCRWRKGSVEAYQLGQPLLKTSTGVSMFRGFELRGQFLWDTEHEQTAFGIVIDAIFAYRDRDNRPLSVASIVADYGSATLTQLRQRQGTLSPKGKINLEVSRQRLLQQTLPFIDARHSFVLPCGVHANLSLVPTRVVIVGEPGA